jgi:hypothetical protein
VLPHSGLISEKLGEADELTEGAEDAEGAEGAEERFLRDAATL